MNAILIFLYSLYFGLLPFDNLKELTGDTINKKLGLIMLAFLFVLFLIKRRKKIIINYFNIFITLMFLVYSLTYFLIFKNTDSNYTRFVFLYLLFIFSSQLELKKDNLIKIFDLSSLIIGIIAISSLLLNFEMSYIDRTHYYIWNNMAVDANIYCSTLIFPILYLMHKLLTKTAKHKFICLSLLFLMLISALFAGSRGGLIAIALGLFILMLTEGNGLKSSNKKIIYFLFLVFALCLAIPYLPDNIINRLSFSAVVEDKASDRFKIWEYALRKYSSANVLEMLFGYGFLSFRKIVNLNAVSHNLIIQTLIEGGIFMIGMLSYFFIKTLKYFNNKKNKLMATYLITILLMSLSIDVIVSRFLWNSFIIIALIINNYKINEKESLDSAEVDKNVSKN